jgi:hypothetical protein
VNTLARRAELIKLGRILGVTPEELAPITPVDATELRASRETISAALFDDVRPMLTRVAKGSKLLPTGLVARVGQAAFGALLCSRIASLLAPKHALEVALHMPNDFLADVSAQIDPRSAGEVVAMIPTERVVNVAAVLVARRDYVTMGRFVDYLSNETLAAVIASIPDELDLLHIATFVESPSKLGELVGMLPHARVRAMIARMNEGDGELWIETLAIANVLDAGWQRTLGDVAADLDASVLEALVAAARRHDLWTAALPLVLAMSPHSARRFIALPCVHEPETLVAILTSAAGMSEGTQQQLAELVGREVEVLVAPIAEALRTASLWEALLPLVLRIAPERRTVLVSSVVESSALDAAMQKSFLSAFLHAARAQGRMDDVRPLLAHLPPHLRDLVPAIVPA